MDVKAISQEFYGSVQHKMDEATKAEMKAMINEALRVQATNIVQIAAVNTTKQIDETNISEQHKNKDNTYLFPGSYSNEASLTSRFPQGYRESRLPDI